MTNQISSKDQGVLDFISEKILQIQTTQNQNARPLTNKISNEMRAVLLIFNADQYLMENVGPFINVETETINWNVILKMAFGSGHKAAVLWAYAVWTDTQPDHGDCFDAAFSMSPHLQIAVLEALCLRWGLRG